MEKEEFKVKEPIQKLKPKPTLIMESLATFQVIPEVDETLSNDGKNPKLEPRHEEISAESQPDIFTNSQGTPNNLPKVASGKK